MKVKRLLSLLLTLALVLGSFSVSAFAAEDETVYALMNIPYAAFYGAEGAAINIDAISSATNKTGNYGKAGGTFHSETTASVAEDGTVTAVGGANGSEIQGAIWPVKISRSALENLGGEEITAETKVTTATNGKGQTSSQELVSYEALTEAKAYSYFILDEAPAYYMEYDGSFSATKGAAEAKAELPQPCSMARTGAMYSRTLRKLPIPLTSWLML